MQNGVPISSFLAYLLPILPEASKKAPKSLTFS
jgi:hypothetical protein